jgi:L-lactate dehydrogenase
MSGTDPTRIGIVGAGHVGATFAHALLRSGLAAEIVLLDANRGRAEGEAMDLGHAVPFERPTRIMAGDWADLAGSRVVVIAAGAGQRPGQSRLDLARRNAEVIRDVAPRIAGVSPDTVLVVATNPVDVLTHVALRSSGLPAARVIGSGTLLDTARFRALLAEHFEVDPRSVHAFIVGEHGDSEVPVWSLANIAGMRLREYCEAHHVAYPESEMAAIFERTRDAAYHIIERKGATYFAIASGLVRLVEAIVRDQATVLSVSSLAQGQFGIDDVCISLPAIVGREGVREVLPLTLTPEEIEQLRRSAAVVQATLREVEGAPAG